MLLGLTVSALPFGRLGVVVAVLLAVLTTVLLAVAAVVAAHPLVVEVEGARGDAREERDGQDGRGAQAPHAVQRL